MRKRYMGPCFFSVVQLKLVCFLIPAGMFTGTGPGLCGYTTHCVVAPQPLCGYHTVPVWDSHRADLRVRAVRAVRAKVCSHGCLPPAPARLLSRAAGDKKAEPHAWWKGTV